MNNLSLYTPGKTSLTSQGKDQASILPWIQSGCISKAYDLKTHQATDPDEIPALILKTAANQIRPIFTRRNQYSLDSCEVPTDWRMPISSQSSRREKNTYPGPDPEMLLPGGGTESRRLEPSGEGGE